MGNSVNGALHSGCNDGETGAIGNKDAVSWANNMVGAGARRVTLNCTECTRWQQVVARMLQQLRAKAILHLCLLLPS